MRSSSRVAQERRFRTFFCSRLKNDCDTYGMLRGKVVSAGVTRRMTDPSGVLIWRYVRRPHRRTSDGLIRSLSLRVTHHSPASIPPAVDPMKRKRYLKWLVLQDSSTT